MSFFNSERYDLNLIREHFVERVAGTTYPNGESGQKREQNHVHYDERLPLLRKIKNYLGPETSYEKWVKADECESVKF